MNTTRDGFYLYPWELYNTKSAALHVPAFTCFVEGRTRKDKSSFQCPNALTEDLCPLGKEKLSLSSPSSLSVERMTKKSNYRQKTPYLCQFKRALLASQAASNNKTMNIVVIGGSTTSGDGTLGCRRDEDIPWECRGLDR